MRWTAPSRSFQNSAAETGAIPVLAEPAIAVDGARGNGREKEEERHEPAGGDRDDQPVPDAEDDIQAAERHVRDPQEPQFGAGIATGRNRAATRGSRVNPTPSEMASTRACVS